jgi:hypothetical protein
MGIQRVFRSSCGLLLLALSGCNCEQRLVELVPQIVVTPSPLSFGTVPVGTVVELPLNVSNNGRGALVISSVMMQTPDDITVAPAAFTVDCGGHTRNVSEPSTIPFGNCASVIVRFNAAKSETLSNVVLIASNDPKNPLVKVPVTAMSPPANPQIQVCVLSATGTVVASQCSNLAATPPVIPTVAFGSLQDGQMMTRTLRILNHGNAPLHVTVIRMMSTSSDLGLAEVPSLPAVIAPNMSVDTEVTFDPKGTGAITGDVIIQSDDPAHGQVAVPVTATEEAPPMCMPPTASIAAKVGSNPVPAGGVLQDTTVTFKATASGGSASPSQYHWSIVAAPMGNTSMLTMSGATATLDCILPGTYEVGVVIEDSDGCSSAQATISVKVDPLPPTCGPATQFIYTIDEGGTLYEFFPNTTTLTTLGPANCPALSTANTMAVDRQGIAWVEYQDGSLYKVNPTTSPPTCYATSFNPSQTSSTGWGSAYVSDTAGSTTDTYFIAQSGVLDTINPTSLAVTRLGTFTGLTGVSATDEGELTGTSSAELYGFFPGTPWVLANLDKSTGAVISQQTIPVISNDIASPGNWAFASWGDDFWFFVGNGSNTSVFHYTASTGTTTKVFTKSVIIVGAGVSPCVMQ